MSRHTSRHGTGPGSPNAALELAVVILLLAVAVADVGVQLAARLDRVRGPSWNPLIAPAQLATGKRQLPHAAIFTVPALLALVTVIGTVAVSWWLRRRPRAGARDEHVDRAARLLATPRQLRPMSERSAATGGGAARGERARLARRAERARQHPAVRHLGGDATVRRRAPAVQERRSGDPHLAGRSWAPGCSPRTSRTDTSRPA